jgi:Domain of unknown function (DUF4188)
MSKVFPGRYAAEIGEPFVMFLIGMRVNRIFAVRKWLRTARAMNKMLRALRTHPEKGFMGGQTIYYRRGIGIIQYWRSFDDLEHFARSPSEPHIDAWRYFNQTIGADGTVGFWHETYMVEPGKHEEVYGNMPIFGLAAAAKHVPAVGQRETARRRIGGQSEPAVPSPVTPGVESPH